MKRTLNNAVLACAVAMAPAALAEESPCYTVSKVVTKAVEAEPDTVLAIVEKHVAASPACACEIVKAAIVSTKADKKLVGQIVATAVTAAPDKIDIITTCAIAVAADALAEIRATVAKLLAENESWRLGVSAKGGFVASPKGGKDIIPPPEPVRNPLDGPYLVPGLPFIHPPLIPSISTPDEFPNVDVLDDGDPNGPVDPNNGP